MILNRKEATLMKLFVGLDVSSFDIKVCFLNSDGDQIKSFTVNNDLAAAMNLRDEIRKITKSRSIDVVRIGLESTSVHSIHPSLFLDNDEALQAQRAKVYVMNAKHIANFKKSYHDMDKADEI